MYAAKSLSEAADESTTLTRRMLPGREGEKPGFIFEFVVSAIREN